MNKVLIEDLSPNRNILATAEDNGRCVYFYLHGAPENEFGVRSCWVRNLRPAPAKVDVETMGRGKAPLLPASFCRDPKGGPPLDPDRLRIVWFEEGDAAGLLEGEEILAVIPGWSGLGDIQRLIEIVKLPEDLAESLNPYVRDTYRKLWQGIAAARLLSNTPDAE